MFVLVHEWGFGRALDPGNLHEWGFGLALHFWDVHAVKARTARAVANTASAGWPRQAEVSFGWLRQAGMPDM
jgi:hypothetical protein